MLTRIFLRLTTVFIALGTVGMMTSFASGASVGRIDEPGSFNLSIGAEHLNREVRTEEDELVVGTFDNTRLHGPNTVERVTMKFSGGTEIVDRLYLRAAYGFKEGDLEPFGIFGRLLSRFGVFGKVGLADHQTRLSGVTVSDQVEDTVFFGTETDIRGIGDLSGRGGNDLLWGLGAQAFLKQDAFRLGVKAEYLRQSSEAGYPLLEMGGTAADPTGQTVSSRLVIGIDGTRTEEIQAAVIFSVVLKSATSYYGGVKVSRLDTVYTGSASRIERDDAASPPVVVQRDPFRLKTRSKASVGFFAGAAYRIAAHVEINAEVRAGDETGITAQMGYYF